MIGNLEQRFLDSVNLVEGISKDEILKGSILAKYETLANAIISKDQASLDEVNNNLDCYSIIINEQILKTVLSLTKSEQLSATYNKLHSMLAVLTKLKNEKGLSDDKYTLLYKKFADNIGGKQAVVSEATMDILNKGLMAYGLDVADDIENDDSDDLSKAIDSIEFDDDNDNKSIFGEDEEPELDPEETFDAEDILGSDDNEENSEEPETFEGDTTEDSESPEDAEGATTEGSEEFEGNVDEEPSEEMLDAIEKFKQIYGSEEDTPLSTAVTGILKSLEELYMSCYSGITKPDGVLTAKGILSLDKVPGTTQRKFMYNHSLDESSVEYLKNKGKYGQYYKAVMYAIGVVSCGASEINRDMDKSARESCINNAVNLGETVFGRAIDGRKDTTPKWADCCNSIYFYPRFHTEFMTGNFTVSKKMQDWAIEHKAKRTSTKITRFSDIMEWAKHRVTECLTEACLDAGVKIEEVGSNDQEITSICQAMSKSIKNIMVITNIKKGYFTLKICSGQPINSQLLKTKILSYFNAMSDGSRTTSITVKNDGSTSGVIEYDIVSDMKEYDKSSSFSADVIDNIIDSGEVPSWSNAIMGEKNDGGTLTVNFKDTYSVAIYGATGSGKGIMTSALLTNAIADGCEVFYFDGKPDNGAALAKVVWDNDAGDAAVFNGLYSGCKSFPRNLEEYSHGVRDLSLRNGVDLIPYIEDNKKWPFNDEKNRTLLYEVSLTLNAFQFVHDAILARTQPENLELLPNGKPRWAVFVIDEIQDAGSTEKNIRELMEQYMEVAGEVEVYTTETKTDTKGNVTSQQKKNGKIKDSKNWAKDTGYLFCKQWLAWADSRCVSWSTLVTKSLRQSHSTLITIFQSNEWLNQNGGAGKTKIGQMMLKVATKTVKIVGKGALVSNNKWGDETSYAWSDEIAKGKWAIAKGDSGLTDDVHILKPFKLFTTDLGDGVPVPLDDRGAGASGCWQSRENKSGRKPLGLQAYLRYMFNGLQPEMQEQVEKGERTPELLTEYGVLSSSLNYFDSLVKNKLDPAGIIHYMYNVSVLSEFNGTASDAQIAEMERIESEGQSLDALNNGLNNESTSETTNSTNPAPSQNKTSPEQQSQVDRKVNFCSTKVLVEKITSGKMNDATLSFYYRGKLIPYIKRGFDFSDRRTGVQAVFAGGLLQAMVVYSNLHAIQKLKPSMFNVLDDLYSITTDKNKINTMMYTKIAPLYDNGSVPYDNIISKEMLLAFANEITNVNSSVPNPVAEPSPVGFEGGSDFGNIETENDAWNSEPTPEPDDWTSEPVPAHEPVGAQPVQYDPEETDYTGRKAKEFAVDRPEEKSILQKNNKGENILNGRQTTPIGVLPADTIVVKKLGFLEKIKKRSYESRHGMSYMMSKYWDHALQTMLNEVRGDRLRVTKIELNFPGAKLNGNRYVPLDEILSNDGDTISLSEIVNLKKLFKTFPNTHELSLDADASEALYNEYGSDAKSVWKLFQDNKKLNKLNVTYSNGTVQSYDRSTYAQTAASLDKNMKEESFKKALDVKMASKNPRASEEPHLMYKAHQKLIGNSADWFKKGHDVILSDGDKKVGKWLGYTAGGLMAVGIGGILGIPHGLKSLKNKIFG